VIVDAFAGGGEYLTQDNQRHNGSPIKIIETVKDIFDNGKRRICITILVKDKYRSYIFIIFLLNLLNNIFILFFKLTLLRIKPHSIAKQTVYTEYIKEYIRTLNSNPLIPNFNIVIVDAFAGGGEYLTQDNQRHNGSPIKIIETVKATEKTINETRKKQFTIKQQYFFLEKKKANLDYLKNHLKNLEYDKFFDTEIVLQQGEFEKEYKNIIKQIQQKYNENVRAIFILDQYGYTDAPFSVIKDI
jgi:hypothetical protein